MGGGMGGGCEQKTDSALYFVSFVDCFYRS